MSPNLLRRISMASGRAHQSYSLKSPIATMMVIMGLMRTMMKRVRVSVVINLARTRPQMR